MISCDGKALKLLWNSVVFLGSFYVVTLAALYFFQTQMLFPAPETARINIPTDAAFFETVNQDGTVLRHVRIRNVDGSPKVIFFHGNGSLAAFEVQRGLELKRAGFDVLLAEYRGYGGSAGTPSGSKLLSDGLETFDQFVGETDVPIFLYAHSLGTGVATHIASRREINAVFLEAPYASLASIAADRFPIFPVKRLFKHGINSAAAAEKINIPVMMVHGEQDRVIPIHHGEELFASLMSSNKIWKAIPQANHNNLLAYGTLNSAAEFFAQFK